MAYRIQKIDGIFEMDVSGTTHEEEILEIIRELDRVDRGKRSADLWTVAEESTIPFTCFRRIAKGIKALFPAEMTGNKTAIVAHDEFHKAQLDMYRSEASMLPFEIRVFVSREKALEWLRANGHPSDSERLASAARDEAASSTRC